MAWLPDEDAPRSPEGRFRHRPEGERNVKLRLCSGMWRWLAQHARGEAAQLRQVATQLRAHKKTLGRAHNHEPEEQG
jgi:hypothetical protein